MKRKEALTRREFVRAASRAAILLAFSPPALRAGSRAEPSARVRLGFIGCGGRGRELLRIFQGFPDVEIPFLCDVNVPRLEEAVRTLGERGRRPELVSDYRRILERKDIDAVVIATCEHWHGLPFIEACRAGKHIFVEKPLSHTVLEGRRMVEAARRARVTALMGTQQRAGTHFQKAVEIVRSGRLGKVSHVECWNYHNARNRGGRPPDSPPPLGLDWDRWLGPAPLVPYNPLRLSYSWWFDYGGGMMTNWAVHHLDAIIWAMGSASPRSVSCMGGLVATDTLSDAPDLVDATWEFPGWFLRYSYSGFSNFHRIQSRPRHHGILFSGSEGSLILDRHGFEVYENRFPEKPLQVEAGSEQDGPWQRHFLDCLKSEKKPAVSLEESHQATVACLLGNIAYHVRRRIPWDGEKEMVPGDPEAAAMLTRPRRKGFELPPEPEGRI